MTALKSQEMLPGSDFRKLAGQYMWEDLGNRYEDTRLRWEKKRRTKENRIINRQNKNPKYYSISLTPGAGASSIPVSQVDPIVDTFNNAKDNAIIPTQSVPYLPDTQFGKDKDGWYAVLPKHEVDDQGRRIVVGERTIRGSKDKIASIIKINSPQLGYNFGKKETFTNDEQKLLNTYISGKAAPAAQKGRKTGWEYEDHDNDGEINLIDPDYTPGS